MLNWYLIKESFVYFGYSMIKEVLQFSAFHFSFDLICIFYFLFDRNLHDSTKCVVHFTFGHFEVSIRF